jgi:hypothetical protein
MTTMTSTMTTTELPKEGDFSFISKEADRMAFEDMWTAISKTEMWNQMATDPGPGGFAWSKAPHIVAIQAALVDRVGHSGASIAAAMREMQRIAKIGWTAYVLERA